MNEHIEDDYSDRNRHKAKEAKYGLTWCPNCDKDVVSDMGKCGHCHTRLNPKKIKYMSHRSSFNS
jgi:hypothetical protein